jgi:hypothetical protein
MNDVSSIRLDLFVGIVKKIAYSLAARFTFRYFNGKINHRMSLNETSTLIAESRKIVEAAHSDTLEPNVLQRSLRYATYRLMVMHPHTKYH